MENHIKPNPLFPFFKLGLMLLFSLQSALALAKNYSLGILAPQGASITQERWQHWVDELNQQLGKDTITLIPLNLQQLSHHIQMQQLDLVLAPPSQLIHADTQYWRWLASLSPNTSQNPYQAMNHIGSTIWVKQNSPIQSIKDLKHKHIAAVDERAFSGYLLGLHILQQAGIHQQVEMVFVGYPIEETLWALHENKVDAAIVPLCLMEEMNQSALLNQHDFRALRQNLNVTTQHCVASSALYPHWVLAATHKAPDDLVQKTHHFLFNHQSALHDIQWQPHHSIQSIEHILMDLNRHPSQLSSTQQIKQWLKNNKSTLFILIAILGFLVINSIIIHIISLRQRLKIQSQHQQLRHYDDLLKKHEKFALMGELSSTIAHELNQPLSAIHHYAEGALLHLSHVKPEDKALYEPIKQAFQQILKQSHRGSSIIQQSRLWLKSYPQKWLPVHSQEIIQQCLWFLSHQLSSIRIYQTPYAYTLSLPYLLLDQILINLLLNAKQQQAQHIFIHHEIIHQSGAPFIQLQIIDDAGGFLPTQLSDFYQPSKAFQTLATTKPQGSGLGLNLCRRLCESVGGKLVISNIQPQAWLAQQNKALWLWQRHHDHYQAMPSTAPALSPEVIGAKITLQLALDTMQP